MEEFEIVSVEDCHHEAVLDHLYNDFFSRERLSVGCQRDLTDRSRLGRYVERLREGVSFAAIKSSSGEVAGISINYLVAKCEGESIPVDYSVYPKPTRAVLYFVEHLERDFDIFTMFGVQNGLEICFLGVKEKYGRLGLATRLAERGIAEACNRHLDFVQSVPTSPVTAHMFSKLGFQVLNELKHSEFYLDGEPAFPFASIDDMSKLVVKILQPIDQEKQQVTSQNEN